MKFFLCGFGDFLLGIPVSTVSSLITFSGEVRGLVEREGGDVYYSLPHYFGFPDQIIRHGIILKPLFARVLQITDERPGSPAETEGEWSGRNILLVTAVEREAEIPEEAVYPLPKLLAGKSREGSIFTGISFAGAAMVVCIDPELAVLRILKNSNAPEEAGSDD
jgi:hypothetical protein